MEHYLCYNEASTDYLLYLWSIYERCIYSTHTAVHVGTLGEDLYIATRDIFRGIQERYIYAN